MIFSSSLDVVKALLTSFKRGLIPFTEPLGVRDRDLVSIYRITIVNTFSLTSKSLNLYEV
ncbi:hypothetical protein Hanom_Chr15g01400481 [Helianthus anomalus]